MNGNPNKENQFVLTNKEKRLFWRGNSQNHEITSNRLVRMDLFLFLGLRLNKILKIVIIHRAVVSGGDADGLR